MFTVKCLLVNIIQFQMNGPTIPKTRSLAHHKFEANRVVFVSFDIETGGEYCGILQISAEIVRVDVLPTVSNNGKISNLKDYSSNIRREVNAFNEYVKPHEGAIWDAHATRIHGLTENHPKILQADGMDLVWPRFLQWFAHHLKSEEVAVLVAYKVSRIQMWNEDEGEEVFNCES